MSLSQIVLTSNKTGANAVQVPIEAGEYYFSGEGNYDGGTAKLVLAQDDPANFADAIDTELTQNGGFPVKVPGEHILGIDFDGGGGSIDVTFTFDRIKQFSKEVSS